MKEVQQHSGFLVAAFTARTTNAAEARPETAQVPGLWQKFRQAFSNGQGETYSVYTDYQSDQDGEYTCGVGFKVGSREDCPSGMEVLEVPLAEYLTYSVNGQSPQGVVAAWQHVWADFRPDHQGYRRTFLTDFEQHSGPQEAALYLGVRKAHA